MNVWNSGSGAAWDVCSCALLVRSGACWEVWGLRVICGVCCVGHTYPPVTGRARTSYKACLAWLQLAPVELCCK